MKPDQLIKRRGKLGLIKAGTDLAGVKDWLTSKLGIDFKVSIEHSIMLNIADDLLNP